MRFCLVRGFLTPVSARARRRLPAPRVRLGLESLEDRCLLSGGISLTPSEPAPQLVGQPITWTSPMDALGRYAIEANKPKVFEDAVKLIASSSGGPGGPAVAEVGAANLQTEPADGSTTRTALPLIKANLSQVGQIDPASVQLRISGLGLVPASYDPKTGVVSYQVTQKLRDKTCTVILTAKSGDKKVETHWTFGIDETGGPAVAAPTATPKK